jgi:hypothetical protein
MMAVLAVWRERVSASSQQKQGIFSILAVFPAPELSDTAFKSVG